MESGFEPGPTQGKCVDVDSKPPGAADFIITPISRALRGLGLALAVPVPRRHDNLYLLSHPTRLDPGPGKEGDRNVVSFEDRIPFLTNLRSGRNVPISRRIPCSS